MASIFFVGLPVPGHMVTAKIWPIEKAGLLDDWFHWSYKKYDSGKWKSDHTKGPHFKVDESHVNCQVRVTRVSGRGLTESASFHVFEAPRQNRIESHLDGELQEYWNQVQSLYERGTQKNSAELKQLETKLKKSRLEVAKLDEMIKNRISQLQEIETLTHLDDKIILQMSKLLDSINSGGEKISLQFKKLQEDKNRLLIKKEQQKKELAKEKSGLQKKKYKMELEITALKRKLNSERAAFVEKNLMLNRERSKFEETVKKFESDTSLQRRLRKLDELASEITSVNSQLQQVAQSSRTTLSEMRLLQRSGHTPDNQEIALISATADVLRLKLERLKMEQERLLREKANEFYGPDMSAGTDR